MDLRSACFGAAAALSALPPVYWAALGLGSAFCGRGPGFGPAALALAAAVCLGQAAAWLCAPAPPAPPDGLLEEGAGKTKALLPCEWRGEPCSSIVSKQS